MTTISPANTDQRTARLCTGFPFTPNCIGMKYFD